MEAEERREAFAAIGMLAKLFRRTISPNLCTK